MELKKLNAGKLRAAGYDARQRVLRVEMEDGSALEYSGVGPDVWSRLSSSGAAWSYYRDNIEEEFTARRAAPAGKTRPAGLDDLFRTPGEDA